MVIGELKTLVGVTYTTGFAVVTSTAAGITAVLSQQVIIEPGTTYLSLQVVIALIGGLLSAFSGGGYLIYRILRLVNRYEERLTALEGSSGDDAP